MSNKNTTCDPDSLDLFLGDKLADSERLVLEEHLETCTACRDRLESLAAEPGVWSEARDFLSSADDVCNPASANFDGVTASILSHDELEALRPEHIRSFLSPTDDPRMLGRFGGYEITGVIGCGGMGVVLKGLDVALNRYVAIKALAPHLATSAAARLRFAREARAAAAVVHENVVAIHAVSEANALPYLVMPYIRGTSLQKRLDSRGALTALEVLRIGRQTAAGLAAAHAQGLVHRDIKPANILLEDGVERLKITDFGLARAADDASLTRSGVIAGTPQFMSPEQARGEAIDARSDLFSLGSVLYAACTGRAPFRAETSYGVLRRITDDTPRPIRELNPEIPVWLATTIEILHAKDPFGRFQSADEVSQLFEQCLAHVQQPTAIPLPESLRVPVAAPAISRDRRRLWWIGGISAALVVTVASVLVLRDRPHDENNAAFDRDEKSVATPDSLATRWNDGSDEKVSEAQTEIEEFEKSVDDDWDRISNREP
ncbi:MAG TPA: protein kinase [Planctomycetaceae bacterium]|jgi:serine/threonine-protein kinase